MQRHLDRCMTLLTELDGIVDAKTLAEAQHLMDHGEPSIGIEYLAHDLVEQSMKVPTWLVAELRELVMDQAELPANLDEWAEG